MSDSKHYATHEDICEWVEAHGFDRNDVLRDGVRLRVMGPGRLAYLEVDTFVYKPGSERQVQVDEQREEFVTETHVVPITEPLGRSADAVEAGRRRLDETGDKLQAEADRVSS